VSGSGKSSLITDTLVPLLKYRMNNACVTSEDAESETAAEEQDETYENEADETELPNAFTSIERTEKIRKCFVIDQKPIGRSKTSCPATYTGMMDRVRKLFAETPRAKELGFTAGNFTVNSKGGCRFCKGEGLIRYHVGWGNFIDIKCERCGGYGFVPETMSVLLDGKSIRDILDMSVDEAVDDRRLVYLRQLSLSNDSYHVNSLGDGVVHTTEVALQEMVPYGRVIEVFSPDG
jgi:excinuclease UvrABC ATPase subunit